MLSNAYFLAKFRFDTAENEPAKICKISAGEGERKAIDAAPQPEEPPVASVGGVPGRRRHGIRQTLEGSFSAVSKPNFASKYAFESSRRDLHNALLCTAPKSHFFKKISKN